MQTRQVSKLFLSVLLVVTADTAFARQEEATGSDLADVMVDTAACAGSAAFDMAKNAEAQAEQDRINTRAQQNTDLTIFTTGLAGLQDRQQRIDYTVAVFNLVLQNPQDPALTRTQIESALNKHFGAVLNASQVTALASAVVR